MNFSDLTLTNQLAGDLQNQQNTINSLNEQLSSGTSILVPSDNPIGAADALGYQTQLAQVTANQSSISTAQAWLGLANQSANQSINAMQSINTIVLQALNSGSNNTQTYTEMAQQVQGVATQLLGLANTSFGSTQIFAGTAGVTQAFSPSGTYNGSSQPFTIKVGTGPPVPASVPGDQLFGGGTSGVQSIFATISSIVSNLNAGPGSTSYSGLQAAMTALTANMNQAENAAAKLGESSQQVATASTAASNTSTELQQVLASVTAVNVPNVTAALQSDLTSYQSALYAVSQTVPKTLAQFL